MKRIYLLFVAAVATLSSVWAQQTIIADKVVAVVGNSAIFYSDVVDYSKQIVAQRKEQNFTTDRSAMSEALEGLLMQKLLYNQALIDSVEINIDGVVAQIDERVDALIARAVSASAVPPKPRS